MEETKLLGRKRKAAKDNNKSLLLSACTDLAELYLKQCQYQKAIEEYATIADIYEKEHKRIEYANSHRAIGEAYLALYNYKKALESQQLYLRLVTEENNELEKQRAYATIGHVYLTWHLETQTDSVTKLLSAYKYFMKSLTIVQSLTEINKLEKNDMLARLFSNLGLVKECQGDHSKAMELLNSSINICKQNDIYEQLSRGYISLASLYEKRGEHNEAIHHYNLAIDVIKKLKDNVELMCAALLAKSEAVIKLADFHSAKQILLKAYKMKSPNMQERKIIEHNLRVVASMCKTEDELLVTSGDKEMKKLYEKMGDGACDLKNFSKAIDYYKLMLQYAEKSGVCGRELASCYYSLAETYRDNRQYNKAVEYFEKEYLLCDNLKDNLNTLSQIADAKEAAGAPITEVRAVYERAFENCRIKKNIKEEKRMVVRCVFYLRRNNQHADAFKLDEYFNSLTHLNSDDESSSSNDESESSELKAAIGNDLNLEDISDDTENSDVENQQTENKNEMAVGRRRSKNFTLKKNAKGESLLHVACIKGRLPVVRHLLEQGHPVNVRDNSGWLPLHEACNYGHLEIVQLLLDKGAAINDRGGTECGGISPLYDAANNGHLRIVECLLDRGASATSKTDQGDTPLNVLKKFHERNPFIGEDFILFQSLIEIMSETLEKVGQKNDSTQYDAGSCTQRNEVPQYSLRKSRTRAISMDEEDGNQAPYESEDVSEYQKVMDILKKKQKNVAETPVKCNISKRPLLQPDEMFDDWLENDTLDEKTPKKRKTNSFGSMKSPILKISQPQILTSPEKSQSSSRKMSRNYSFTSLTLSDEDFEELPGSSSRTTNLAKKDQKRTSNDGNNCANSKKQKSQVSLMDVGICRRRSTSTAYKKSPLRKNSFEGVLSRQQQITSFGYTKNLVEADSTSKHSDSAVTKEKLTSGAFVSGDVMVYVDVRIEGLTFRVPVYSSQIQTNTIGWLAEQAANKYARKECTKPTLEMATISGALLSDEDPLSLLFPLGSMQSEPVVGRIMKLCLPPLVERYKEACLQMETGADETMCRILEEMSTSLNIRNKGFFGTNLAPLCRALNHQASLLELDLSGNYLDNDCIAKLCFSLPSLLNLTSLNLRCTGISTVHLADIAAVILTASSVILPKLVSLNLSDNFLKDKSLQHIARITNHLKLTSLDLANVRFTKDLFRGSGENVALDLKNIQSLDISNNELDAECVKRFMSWIDPDKISELNISRNCAETNGILGHLVDVLKDRGGQQLKYLNLSRCNVQETELYDFLRLISRKRLTKLNLSYNEDLTGISLRRLLEHPNLRDINLIGCVNIYKYFDDFEGRDLLQDSGRELKISVNTQDYSEQVKKIVAIFKSTNPHCRIELGDKFMFLSTKK